MVDVASVLALVAVILVLGGTALWALGRLMEHVAPATTYRIHTTHPLPPGDHELRMVGTDHAAKGPGRVVRLKLTRPPEG